MRGMSAARHEPAFDRAAYAADDGFDLPRRAVVVVLSLNCENGTADRGQPVRHSPVAHGRVLPSLDPAAEHGVDVFTVVPGQPLPQIAFIVLGDHLCEATRRMRL